VSKQSGKAPPRAVGRGALGVVYLLLPLVFGFAQWRLNATGVPQIRFEEIAEAIRNVYWLDRRLIYDGISSNVGWYGTLLVSYKLFGFSATTAKAVKLAIAVAGWYAAADILRRVVSLPAAAVALVALGLSPTLLYFNGLETSFGIDVPYAAICLWLVLGADPARLGAAAARLALAGLVGMTAALSYPTFLIYIPSLLVVVWWRWRGAPVSRQLAMAGTAMAAAAALFAGALAWLDNASTLLHDPATGTGVFRGGGHLAASAGAFAEWIRVIGGDLFIRTQSYHAEISRPEFGGAVVWLVLAVFSAGAVLETRGGGFHPLTVAVWLLLAASLILPGLSAGGPPGLRRATPLIIVFVAFVAMAWRYREGGQAGSAMRVLVIAASVLLVGDRAVKVMSLTEDASVRSEFSNQDWYLEGGTPDEAVRAFVRAVETGRPLSCPIDAGGRIAPCRYQDIYPAIAGTFAWNRRAPRDVTAVDWRSGQVITLSPALWTTRYYPH
jgi:hypothetical protein